MDSKNDIFKRIPGKTVYMDRKEKWYKTDFSQIRAILLQFLLLNNGVYIQTRGVTIHFYSDSIRITIHGWRYDTWTILIDSGDTIQ